ncbi:MAG: phosphate signaling complex protein PhoU, partial [Pseudomonadota bacterium]
MASSTHIVRSYAEELGALDVDISQMGGLAESQLSSVIDAVARRDVSLAERVVANDRRVDALERQVEARVFRLLALRQPVAIDLRTTISAIKTAGELERVADLAKNIAKRALVLSAEQPLRASTGVLRMGRLSLTRLSDVLNAYSQRDVEKA